MTPCSRPFAQVDVFTAEPYLGNPLAVVLDAQGLSPMAMQAFTHWTNLSECTFVLPPSAEGAKAGADYQVRIFCPGRELPFAGHPTLGTAHAWLEAGGVPRQKNVIVQECGAGLVKVRQSAGQLAFAAPPLLKSGPLDEADVALIAQGLGVPRSDIVAHAWCDNGPNWRGVLLRSAEQVLSLRPDARVLAGLDIGVVGPRAKVGVMGAFEGLRRTTPEHAPKSAPEHAPDFEVRAFFPGNNGLAEDPVTGSLNAALAQWLIPEGRAPQRYLVAQGSALGRAGRVAIEQDEQGCIWVGGESVTCVRGQAWL